MSDTSAGLYEFIVSTLTTRFGVPETGMTPETDLETLGIDSLGGVELSLAIKKKYGVAFVAGEITVKFTLAGIAALAERKLAEIQPTVVTS